MTYSLILAYFLITSVSLNLAMPLDLDIPNLNEPDLELGFGAGMNLDRDVELVDESEVEPQEQLCLSKAWDNLKALPTPVDVINLISMFTIMQEDPDPQRLMEKMLRLHKECPETYEQCHRFIDSVNESMVDIKCEAGKSVNEIAEKIQLRPNDTFVEKNPHLATTLNESLACETFMRVVAYH